MFMPKCDLSTNRLGEILAGEQDTHEWSFVYETNVMYENKIIMIFWNFMSVWWGFNLFPQISSQRNQLFFFSAE